MTRCITARNGQRIERLSRLPSAPRIHRAGHPQPPSQRFGVSWRALPVEGSRAWQRSQAGILARIFNR
jgi:hypothetical protein